MGLFTKFTEKNLHRYSNLAKTEGCEATGLKLLAQWNAIASFAGLSGGFCFFVITSSSTFTMDSFWTKENIQQAFLFILTVAFMLNYACAALSLGLITTLSVMLKGEAKNFTPGMEKKREEILLTFYERFQAFFDVPMVIAVGSIGLITTGLLLFLLGNAPLWIFWTSLGLIVVLAIIIGTTTAIMNAHHIEAMYAMRLVAEKELGLSSV